MKLFTTIIVSSCLAAQAFGVSPVVSKSKGLSKPALISKKSPLRQKNAADMSPLFRDPTVTRGGAIPGLDAYSEALDKNPITTKALTSLAGWFFGDLLAQVSPDSFRNFVMAASNFAPLTDIFILANALSSRSSLLAAQSTGSVLQLFPSSDSFTTAHLVTTSTTGLTSKSLEPTPSLSSARLPSIRSSGAPSS